MQVSNIVPIPHRKRPKIKRSVLLPIPNIQHVEYVRSSKLIIILGFQKFDHYTQTYFFLKNPTNNRVIKAKTFRNLTFSYLKFYPEHALCISLGNDETLRLIQFRSNINCHEYPIYDKSIKCAEYIETENSVLFFKSVLIALLQWNIDTKEITEVPVSVVKWGLARFTHMKYWKERNWLLACANTDDLLIIDWKTKLVVTKLKSSLQRIIDIQVLPKEAKEQQRLLFVNRDKSLAIWTLNETQTNMISDKILHLGSGFELKYINPESLMVAGFEANRLKIYSFLEDGLKGYVRGGWQGRFFGCTMDDRGDRWLMTDATTRRLLYITELFRDI